MDKPRKPKTVLEQFTIRVLEASELALFIILGITVFIGISFLTTELWSILTGGIESANTIALKTSKEILASDILVIMDVLFLLVIGVDVMRTLAISIIERKLYTQAVLEAALIAVVREIISSELRHRAAMDILLFSVVILVLVLSILIAKKYL